MIMIWSLYLVKLRKAITITITINNLFFLIDCSSPQRNCSTTICHHNPVYRASELDWTWKLNDYCGWSLNLFFRSYFFSFSLKTIIEKRQQKKATVFYSMESVIRHQQARVSHTGSGKKKIKWKWFLRKELRKLIMDMIIKNLRESGFTL